MTSREEALRAEGDFISFLSFLIADSQSENIVADLLVIERMDRHTRIARSSMLKADLASIDCPL
jgi:hypothetical protein